MLPIRLELPRALYLFGEMRQGGFAIQPRMEGLSIAASSRAASPAAWPASAAKSAYTQQRKSRDSWARRARRVSSILAMWPANVRHAYLCVSPKRPHVCVCVCVRRCAWKALRLLGSAPPCSKRLRSLHTPTAGSHTTPWQPRSCATRQRATPCLGPTLLQPDRPSVPLKLRCPRPLSVSSQNALANPSPARLPQGPLPSRVLSCVGTVQLALAMEVTGSLCHPTWACLGGNRLWTMSITGMLHGRPEFRSAGTSSGKRRSKPRFGGYSVFLLRLRTWC